MAMTVAATPLQQGQPDLNSTAWTPLCVYFLLVYFLFKKKN